MGFRVVGRVAELDSICAGRHWFHSRWGIRSQITDAAQHKANLCAVIAGEQWDKLPHKVAGFPLQEVVHGPVTTCQGKHGRGAATVDTSDP